MEGILSKKGNIFGSYSKKYHFILEGDCIKYGRIGKDNTNSVELKDAVISLGKS